MLPSLNLRFFVFALLSILLVDKIGAQEADLGEINIPVSYTHLTLPTILRV